MLRSHRHRSALFLSFAFLLLSSLSAWAADPASRVFAPVQLGYQPAATEMPVYMPGRVLVKLTQTAQRGSRVRRDLAYLEALPRAATGLAAVDRVFSGAGVETVRRAFIHPRNEALAAQLGIGRWLLVEGSRMDSPVALAERLAKLPEVEAVTLDYIAFPAIVPSDPLHSMHWGHNNTAQLLSYN